MTNLCRDEVTQVLKDKIEAVFGSSFNTNGLGGVLTCGVTGMKAGLSHSPVCNVSALTPPPPSFSAVSALPTLPYTHCCPCYRTQAMPITFTENTLLCC